VAGRSRRKAGKKRVFAPEEGLIEEAADDLSSRTAVGSQGGAPEPLGGAGEAAGARIDIRGAAVVAAEPFRDPEGSWGLKVGGIGAAVIVANPLRTTTPLAPEETAEGTGEAEEEPLPEGAGWEEV
jgi:hypothetical protein